MKTGVAHKHFTPNVFKIRMEYRKRFSFFTRGYEARE